MMINGEDCRAALAYLRSVGSPSLEIALGIAARQDLVLGNGYAVADLIAVLEHLDEVATRVIELQGDLMAVDVPAGKVETPAEPCSCSHRRHRFGGSGHMYRAVFAGAQTVDGLGPVCDDCAGLCRVKFLTFPDTLDRPGAGVDESPRPGPAPDTDIKGAEFVFCDAPIPSVGDTVVTVCLPGLGLSLNPDVRARRDNAVLRLVEAAVRSGGSFHVQAPR